MPTLRRRVRGPVAALTCLALAGSSCTNAPPAPPAAANPSAPAASAAPSPSPAAFRGWSDPALVGAPYGTTVPGVLTFRGNPTRTFYGTGPAPRTEPKVLWRFPKTGNMCSLSDDGNGPRTWCGTGWTGQPAIFERAGRMWVVFGAYDRAVHFLDAATGERILPDFLTGDIIKGSVTVDPDGYPLVYIGSRDNYFRVLAFDRDRPTELWKLSAYAVSPTLFNNDWDGAGLVLGDYLFEGGENGQLHIVKLNRSYDPDGKVRVAPKLVFNAPGWDSELLRSIGNRDVQIESSLAIYRDTLYFANSGGLVQGWDIAALTSGQKPRRVFRYWAGDDIDATITIDADGMLYVGVEYEKHRARSQRVGQMIKLDPGRTGDPLVWSVHDRSAGVAGVWGTPALYRDIVIFDTNSGDVLGIDRVSGAVRWRLHHPRTWQSPVVVDDVLFIGDCAGDMHAYDVADTTAEPTHLWTKRMGSCIESTPAVWKGRLYFGTRGGGVYALG